MAKYVHKKVNVINQQSNVNQNHNVIMSYPRLFILKDRTINIGQNLEKLKLSYTAGGKHKMVHNCSGQQSGNLRS